MTPDGPAPSRRPPVEPTERTWWTLWLGSMALGAGILWLQGTGYSRRDWLAVLAMVVLTAVVALVRGRRTPR